jgi:hypothetical protein
MRALWKLTFMTNMVVVAYFTSFHLTTIAVHFNAQGLPNGYMSGKEHTIFMLGVLLFANLLLYGIFRWSLRMKFLEYANIPNYEFWMATPDRRLDVLTKVQNLLALVGVWVNSLFIFVQWWIYFVNMHKDQYKPEIMMKGFMVIVGLMVTSLFVYVHLSFKMPKNN